MTCPHCKHARVFGWWGADIGRGTHCKSCHRSWTAGSHCYATESGAFSVRRCDPSLAAGLDAVALEAAPDHGRVGTCFLGDLLSTEACLIQLDEHGRIPPASVTPHSEELGWVEGVLRSMFLWGQHKKIVQAVVSGIAVDVMYLVALGGNPDDYAVFVGFDVGRGADTPSEPDIAVAADVAPVWFTVGDRLTGPNVDRLAVPGSALSTDAFLRRPGDRHPAVAAGFGDLESHGVILTQWGCHQHFSSGTGFDTHQKQFECRSLSELVYTCQAPRFTLVGDMWTGTVHRAFGEGCRDWTRCA